MIRVIRSVSTIRPQEASEVALAIVDHVKSKHSQRDIGLFVDRFCDSGRKVHWHIDFDDLGHYEKWQKALAGDQAYGALLKKAAAKDLFDESTMTDSVQIEAGAAIKSIKLH
jgi:hypothetical protein